MGGTGEQPQGHATSWGGTSLSCPTQAPPVLVQITAVTDLPERAATPWPGSCTSLAGNPAGSRERAIYGGCCCPPGPLLTLIQPGTLVSCQPGSPTPLPKGTQAFPDSPEAPGMGFILPPAFLPAKQIDASPARKSQDSQQDPALLSLISLE